MRPFFNERYDVAYYWSPSLVAGALVWVAFLLIGETPLIRAGGLTLTIVGITLALRRMGAFLSLIGGLTLAFSPAFWSQTGGAQSLLPATTVLATLIAGVSAIAFIRITKRPYIALGLGLLAFSVIFWTQIGTPRSMRLTGLLSAWLLAILVEMLLISNPRPEGPPPVPIRPQQYMGLLIILFVGVVNDPLFVLLLPACAMGLWLSQTPLRGWYWLLVLGVGAIGVWSIGTTYIHVDWWSASSVAAHEANVRVPYVIADGWREGIRWVDLIKLIIQQTTVIGAALSVLGLTRMTRWYPVLGIVLMIAYAFYAVFGLVYFGGNREILLMPLFAIQVIWLTYAVFTFTQWLLKGNRPEIHRLRWAAVGIYALLPVYLLTRL